MECSLHGGSNLQTKLVLVWRCYHLKTNGHAFQIQSHGNVRCRKTEYIEQQQTVNTGDIEERRMEAKGGAVERWHYEYSTIAQHVLSRE